MTDNLKMNVFYYIVQSKVTCNVTPQNEANYEGWNFNSGNYLFTTDTK